MRIGQVVIMIIFVIGIVFSIWWFTKTGSEMATNIPPVGPIELQGEIVCLPHKNSNGIHTLECAYGLLDDNSNYYSLRDNIATSGPSIITSVPTGSKVEVTGYFTTEESDKYNTVGSISIDELEIVDKDNSTETDNLHSDGTLTFKTPNDFGLAISDEQILIDAAIPPCGSDFLYCLYYIDKVYSETNFESAGVGIMKRDDLNTEQQCLSTSPEGYSETIPVGTLTEESYSISVFAPLGNAGAGHYTNSEIYRLFTNDFCYQFELRVGESQLSNYPEESVTEFTNSNRISIMDKLRNIVSEIVLTQNDSSIRLPDIETTN